MNKMSGTIPTWIQGLQQLLYAALCIAIAVFAGEFTRTVRARAQCSAHVLELVLVRHRRGAGAEHRVRCRRCFSVARACAYSASPVLQGAAAVEERRFELITERVCEHARSSVGVGASLRVVFSVRFLTSRVAARTECSMCVPTSSWARRSPSSLQAT